jgi:hypothetical protein
LIKGDDFDKKKRWKNLLNIIRGIYENKDNITILEENKDENESVILIYFRKYLTSRINCF